MKKAILSAMTVTLFVFSCDKNNEVKQAVHSQRSEVSTTIELFDGDTEKAYRFSFNNLYTPEITYTQEIADVTFVEKIVPSGPGLLIKTPSLHVVPL